MTPRKAIVTRSDPDGIAQLVRTRRGELDWSLAKLARASGLRSPAYIFHIENGTKAPSPAVARRLAAALGLDPELFAAWATARGRADLGSALVATETLRRWLRGRATETALLPRDVAALAAGGEQPPGDAVATAEPQGADAVAVPVLPEGADPDAGPVAERAIETLRLDRALFPPLDAGARLVGYRLSAHGARRIPELLRPGDCVVVLLGAEPPGPDTPCAVRIGARIEIARVRMHEAAIHLPPPGGANDSERADARLAPTDAERIAGRVVLVIRRWL